MRIFTSVSISLLTLLPFMVKAGGLSPADSLSMKPNETRNFYEIQEDFYNHWAPYHVVNGKYVENGVEKKAQGWNQFKRWEYFWENRINPLTGQFPLKLAADIYLEQNSRSSRNISNHWVNMGPFSSAGGYAGLGRLNCVAFRPGDNNTYYTGSPSGGLWKTTDNGASWIPLTDENAVLGVSDAIVIAGTTPNTDTIFIATGDREDGSMWTLSSGNTHDNNSIGVLRSVDGGQSWNTTGLTFSASQRIIISRIIMDPDNKDILYAATTNGLYKTTNRGDSWSMIYNANLCDLELKPSDGQVIYASNKYGSIYRSEDAGATWNQVYTNPNGRRTEIAVSADDPLIVYAVMEDCCGRLFGFFKSSNSGTSFTMVYDGSLFYHNLLGTATNGANHDGQGWYDLAIAASPADANTVYVGGINTHKSTNGGSSWSAVNCWTSSYIYNKNNAPVVHADKHMLKFREDDNVLFETNDGGIYYTNNSGGSWHDKTNGIVLSQMYRLGVSATNATEVLTGLQDNGTKMVSNAVWYDKRDGDGMECAIDYTNSSIQYSSRQFGNFRKTINHWVTSTDINSGINETATWVTPFVIDPNDHNTIYEGRTNVWKSTNMGSSWTKISSINSPQKIRSIAVAPNNSQVIYAADRTHIWRTADGGATWSPVTNSLPVLSSYITYVTVKDDNCNTVWVSLGQYNQHAVYETTDGGTTWTNISTGIPEVPVMCVIQNKQDTNRVELYAGTDIGVYVKKGQDDWIPFDAGLPNVVVNELEIYYNNENPSFSKLRAATSGRGLWESNLYEYTLPPPAEFTANTRIACTNDSVTLFDQSENAESWSWNFYPDNATYVNNTSPSSQNPQVQFSNEDYYEVSLIVSNEFGEDSITKSEFIHITDYCKAAGGGGCFIQRVVFGTIDNGVTGNSGYADYCEDYTSLISGQSENIDLYFGNSQTDDTVAGWIDWNQDGDFEDDNEQVFLIDVQAAVESATVHVPDSALLGFTRMRIRNKHSGVSISPCDTIASGEVEDYAVEVKAPPTATWQGVSSMWNQASNWNDEIIPDETYNVTIPSNPAGGNFPIIPQGFTAKCHKLTLDTNAIVTVNGQLEIDQ